jgi:hypothetical protein
MITTELLPIELEPAKMAAFCKKWHIAKLEVFSQVLRNDFRPDSDLDFLYTPALGSSVDWRTGHGRRTEWPTNSQRFLAERSI